MSRRLHARSIPPSNAAGLWAGDHVIHTVPVRRLPLRTDIEVITVADQLETLAPEWQALWAGSEHASAFTAPGWLLAWWRHLGGGPLRVFTARSEGRLVGLLPMFIHSDAGTARLLPLGISVSDRFDLVAAPGWSGRVAAALMNRLCNPGSGWDRWELHETPPDSPLRSLAAATFMQSVSPVLDLDRFAALPARSSARRRLARARQAASAAGLTLDRPGAEALDDLFRLHAAQWATRGKPGVLATAQVQAFHRQAEQALAKTNTTSFQRLRDGARTVAVLYGVQHGRLASAYASGIDPAYTKLGLGTVLIGAAIEAAHAGGATAFDFLRGSEPYKYAWGAVDQPLLRFEYPTNLPLGRQAGPGLHLLNQGRATTRSLRC